MSESVRRGERQKPIGEVRRREGKDGFSEAAGSASLIDPEDGFKKMGNMFGGREIKEMNQSGKLIATYIQSATSNGEKYRIDVDVCALPLFSFLFSSSEYIDPY